MGKVAGAQNFDGRNWHEQHIAKPVSYTHLRAHETRHDLVCRLLLEKKKQNKQKKKTKHANITIQQYKKE